MSLQTPIQIRELQRKLYQKAKGEPNYRFYLLYDKICREDILVHSYELAKANQGAPGVDGQTFEQIETAGWEEWLDGIRNDLRAKVTGRSGARKTRSGRCTSCFARATPRWWTRICPSTLTAFCTPS